MSDGSQPVFNAKFDQGVGLGFLSHMRQGSLVKSSSAFAQCVSVVVKAKIIGACLMILEAQHLPCASPAV